MRKKIDKTNVLELLELSGVQKGMLFHYLRDDTGNIYNVQVSLQLEGTLDPVLLQQAFVRIQGEHEVLRSVFEWERISTPVQIVLKETPLAFQYVDVSMHAANDIPGLVEQCTAQDFAVRFDLASLPMRVTLIRQSANSFILTITHHHILYDGWSTGILIKALFDAYGQLAGGRGAVQAGRPAYKEVLLTGRKRRRPEAEEQYWKQYLAGYEALSLFADRPGQGEQAALLETKRSLPLAVVETVANRYRVTPAALLCAAYGLLLLQFSNRDDIVFGTTVSSRQTETAGIEEVIGNFINTIPLRVSATGDQSLEAVVKGVQQDLVGRNDYHVTAYHEINQWLQLGPDERLFDSVLVIENYPLDEKSINAHAGLQVKLRSVQENTGIPLLVTVFFRQELEIEFAWKPGAISDRLAHLLIDRLVTLLQEIATNGQQPVNTISLVTGQDKDQLLATCQGPVKPLSRDKTVYELFMEQVERTPGSVAVEHNGLLLTYLELSKRATALAIHLSSLGIQRGTHVALCMPRGIDFLVSMLAVFQTGAAYIPIDVQYPSARVQEILSDSDAAVLLTTEDMDAVLPVVRIDRFDYSIPAQQLPLNIALNSHRDIDNLAYIIYTSGTTGKPKGVMIRQLGMINHLLAKIEDLQLTDSDRIAQTASPCFDISVWQFLAGLLVGARTVVIDAEQVLDPSLLLASLKASRITIFESVPSLITTFLDTLPGLQAGALDDLRWMIPTGEALDVALAKKWYHRFPAVPLMNAYGPTEASDDVTHYVVPQPITDLVAMPIGRPVRNTRIYVLDRYLHLVPASVAGSVYIAGPGVGMGYWKDAVKTAHSFIPNPFATTAEDAAYGILYRTGDLGYYREDGMLVYSGREDEQVKIRGNRIEPGEVQARLSAFAGIQETAVVVKGSPENKLLAAYYISEAPIEEAVLKAWLLKTLPGYMVPAAFMRLDKMPLTPNGKLDKKALPEPAWSSGDEYVAPHTPAEKALAGVWSKVLGRPAISVTSNFFAIGGDSIKSIQLSAGMRSAGYQLAVNDIFAAPTIQTMALKLQATQTLSDQSVVTGVAPLTPIQQWFFATPFLEKHQYNQSVLLRFPHGLTAEAAGKIAARLQEHHDALRMVYTEEPGAIRQTNRDTSLPVSVSEYILTDVADWPSQLDQLSNALQTGINLRQGPLMRLGLFQTPAGSHLLIVIHHLVVDGISWRILFEDIDALYRQLSNKQPFALPAKSNAFLSWSGHLAAYAGTPVSQDTKEYWSNVVHAASDVLPRDHQEDSNVFGHNVTQSFYLSKAETDRLLTSAHAPFRTRINDLLLAALVISLAKQFGISAIKIDLEGHGRENVLPGLDYSRTIGWFTSVYPVLLESTGSLRDIIRGVKETLRQVPANGIDYLLQAGATTGSGAQISFNYLGQFDADIAGASFAIADGRKGQDVAASFISQYDWDISGLVADGQLRMDLLYSREQYLPATMERMMDTYRECLVSLIDYCCAYNGRELTPGDITYKALPVSLLDTLQQQYAVADIYPLSPMQEGMLFHALLDPGSDQYFQQMTCHIQGVLDKALVEQCLNELIQRHVVLRTIFLHHGYDRPLQLVLQDRKITVHYKDMRTAREHVPVATMIASLLAEDKAVKFDLTKDVLVRLTILRVSEQEYQFIWSHHHILMDGWCVGIIMREFRALYAAYARQAPVVLPPVAPYAGYIGWLEARDATISANYWQSYLSGYGQPALLPKKEQISADAVSFAAAEHQLLLSGEETKLMMRVSGDYSVTISTLFHTAWGILLAKYNNTKDVVFGSVVSGRPAEIAGVEDMVGLFINTVPVRVQYNESDTVGGLLQVVQEQSLQSGPHHYQSMAAIQAASELGRALLDHILIFENYPLTDQLESGEADTYRISDVQVYEQTNYGLSVIVLPGEALVVKFAYDANQYEADTIDGIARHLKHVLLQMAATPVARLADIRLLTEAEAGVALLALDHTAVSWPTDKTIHQLFAAQVAKHPDRTALSYEGKTISYRELDERSTRLGFLLREKGVRANTIVGLLTDRRIETVVGMLAILKAGGAYLPIDVDYPEERKIYLIGDSGIQILLTTLDIFPVAQYGLDVVYIEEGGHGSGVLPVLPAVNHPDDLCYIIYTSGTTGHPKGVMVEHRNVVRLFFNEAFQFQFGPEDTWTMFHSHCFDFSVWEIYGALLFGGRVIIIPRMVARDTAAYLDLLRHEQVTILNQTPGAFYNLIQEDLARPAGSLRLRYVIFGGEALSPARLKAWHERYPAVKLINMFGITETTVHVTYKEIGDYEIRNNISNIGKPIPTLSVYILDHDGRLLPKGIMGELYVGGAGVARGYLGKEALTARKFVPHPYREQERLYRSGDLARILPSGDIEYMGRMDDQVKIRGFRIELGEIANQLNGHSLVTESVVLPKKTADSQQLVAYYVASTPVETSGLREYLSARLPEYMVPSWFVFLDKLPLTANGKLDKKALPDPVVSNEQDHVAPRTAEERLLAGIWAGVLGIDTPGITDHFFSVGGDSIKSIQIASRLRAAGYEVSVKDIFTSPTIQELALKMKVLTMAVDRPLITGEAALSPIQYWFFESPVVQQHHFNQSVLLHFRDRLDRQLALDIFGKLQEHHDALRMVFKTVHGQIVQENKGTELPVSLQEYDLRGEEHATERLTALATELQGSIDLQQGPLMKLGLFHLQDGSRLLIIIHHLVVDGVSWRILYEDLETLYQQFNNNQPAALPSRTSSFLSWPAVLADYRKSPAFEKATKYWQEQVRTSAGTISRDYPAAQHILRDHRVATFSLPEQATSRLLTAAHGAFRTRINDLLLAALSVALYRQFGAGPVRVDMEGHGREDIGQDTDYSRTVGWFTSIYPVWLNSEPGNLSATVKQVKEMLRQIPHNGLDYLLLKSQPENYLDTARSSIRFNYLGQFDNDWQQRSFSIASEGKGYENAADEVRTYDWDISGVVEQGQLRIDLLYSAEQYKVATVAGFLQAFEESLQTVIDHCCSQQQVVLTPSDLTYKGLSIEQLDTLQRRYAIEDIYALSPMQKGILFHALLDPEADHYFEQVTCRIAGPADVTEIAHCMNQLAARHAVLRTVFLRDGYDEPLQLVQASGKVDVNYQDLRTIPDGSSREQLVEDYRQQDRLQQFDLSNGPLMRLTVLQLGYTDYAFIWSHHHILMDGWCMGILIQEFQQLYAAAVQQQTLPLPAVQLYSRYIDWLAAVDKQAAAIYWSNYLAGYETPATLPGKAPVARKQEHRSAFCDLVIDQAHTRGLVQLSRVRGITVNTIFQAAWGILLGRYNNTHDVVFGSVVSGRPASLTGVESMIGLFINTIPVRVQLQEAQPVETLLQDLQQAALTAQPFHHYPLPDIQALSEPGRSLIDHILVFENYPMVQQVSLRAGPGLQNGPLVIDDVQVFEQTHYDLTVAVVPGDTIQVRFNYNVAVYDEHTIKRMAGHLHQILGDIVSRPSATLADLSMITPAEEREILHVFNHGAEPYSQDDTILSLFEKQVSSTPDKTAVVFGRERVTYRELNKQANRWAHYFRARGIKPGALIPICMERSLRNIIGIIALLKADAAYVPIDPQYPPDRIAFMIADAGSKIALTTVDCRHALPQDPHLSLIIWEEQEDHLGDERVEAPARQTGPDGLAYMMYTSGSTGRPKGVVVQQKNVVSLLKGGGFVQLSAADCLLATGSPSFDATTFEYWGMLLNGGLLVICPEQTLFDSRLLRQEIAAHEVNIMWVTSSLLNQWVNTDLGIFAGLRTILAGGEKLSATHIDRLMKTYPALEVINGYGPTENTTFSLTYKIPAGSNTTAIPIGRPLHHRTAYVLDHQQRLCPVGVPGELYLGGAGVARGYLNQPVLTTEKFVPDPFSKETAAMLYRTGDLAAWMPDGNMAFFGRIDDQVKIRGFRIEPGEIASLLNSHAGIVESVVLIKTRDDSKYLVAYYVAASELEPADLRNFLAARLPEYMLPAAYHYLPRWPLTKNGKLDKKALPDPSLTPVEGYVAPRSGEEILLAAIWSAVLSVEQLGITDNYFMLGGDSIKSIQIASRVRAAGYELSVRDIFVHPTIGALASRLQKATRLQDQGIVTGKAPLSPVQQWFFAGPVVTKQQYNQSVLLHFPDGLSINNVQTMFAKLLEHHDALRMVFMQEHGDWWQVNRGIDLSAVVHEHRLTGMGDEAAALLTIADQLQAGINLSDGPVLQLGLFQMTGGSRLLIVVHHLVIDAVSWRILFEDIEQLYRQITKQQPLALPLKTASFLSWPACLSAYAQTPAFRKAMHYWQNITKQPRQWLPRDHPAGKRTVASNVVKRFALTRAETVLLLGQAHAAFHTEVNDLLLAALVLAVRKQFNIQHLTVDMEGHGREEIQEGADYSRTIGWFTSIYLVWLETMAGDVPDTVKSVKEALRSIPHKGFDYLMLYPQAKGSSVLFNYLGQFDADTANRSYTVSEEGAGQGISLVESLAYDWEMTGMVTAGCFQLSLTFSKEQYREATIDALLSSYRVSLLEILHYCAGLAVPVLTPSDMTWKGISIDQLDQLQQQVAITDLYQLSPLQEGMLYHALLEPASAQYFVQMTSVVHGTVDKYVLQESMDALVKRHDVLRTVFLHEQSEQPIQVVLKARTLPIDYRDIVNLPSADAQQQAVRDCQQADMARKFDLAHDPLMRLTVLQTGKTDYVFIWSYHHILMDGWCMNILLQEFNLLYAACLQGKVVALPAAPAYAHYIAWLRERDEQAALQYWGRYLTGYDNLASLRVKEPLAAGGAPFRLMSHQLQIDKGQTRSLQQTAADMGITVNTLIQAAWGVLLAKYNYTRDVVFGSVVSGRPPEVAGVESMIGLFINTIPVRVRYQGDETIESLLLAMQRNALDSEPYHYSPLQAIQSASEAGRALLDHILVFENYPVAEALVSGSNNLTDQPSFTITGVEIVEQTNYDLSVIIVPGEAMVVRFDYNETVYKAPFIQETAQRFTAVLMQLVADRHRKVTDIGIVTESEKDQLLHAFNNTAVPLPVEDTLVSVLADRAQTIPHHTAVIFGDSSFTYRQVQEAACKMGAYLRAQGIGAGDLVGLVLEREAFLLQTIFGIMKAGAAYVPIDPHQPMARIQAIIDDSRLKGIVTRRQLLPAEIHAPLIIDLDNNVDAIHAMQPLPPDDTPTGDQLAYVIYTSGSTGTPKGVMVEHRAVMNGLRWLQANYPLAEQEVVLQKTPLAFDVSVWELGWWPLAGAALYLLPPGAEKDPYALLETISRQKIAAINFVPSMLVSFLTMLETTHNYSLTDSLRYVFSTGEALKPEQVNRFCDTLYRYGGKPLINLYGPTEAAVETTCYPCVMDQETVRVPIGRPLHNVQLYILDQDGQLAPIGVNGELCIGGAGLARGYLHNEALTAEKFVSNPHVPGAVLYRTGDLASWLPDGHVEYFGRLDNQVKIRGFRIELGEIECRLQSFPGIRECVVVVREQADGAMLVAYYVANEAFETNELKGFLLHRLPAYMVPAAYVYMNSLPLTKSEKLDRKALPDVVFKGAAGMARAVNQTQKDLVQLWAEVLQVKADVIGVDTNFFDIGGNSLRLLMLVNKINKHFHTSLPVATLFKFPVISLLAGLLDNGTGDTVDDTAPELESAFEQRNETLQLLNKI